MTRVLLLMFRNITLQGVTTDKTLYIIDGNTIPGVGSGIRLNNGITGISIKDLTVQNFNGTNGNSDAGILCCRRQQYASC